VKVTLPPMAMRAGAHGPAAAVLDPQVAGIRLVVLDEGFGPLRLARSVVMHS
jgi:hypothetical protein